MDVTQRPRTKLVCTIGPASNSEAALRDLIGGIDTEQILDEVFRRFCVGK